LPENRFGWDPYNLRPTTYNLAYPPQATVRLQWRFAKIEPRRALSPRATRPRRPARTPPGDFDARKLE